MRLRHRVVPGDGRPFDLNRPILLSVLEYCWWWPTNIHARSDSAFAAALHPPRVKLFRVSRSLFEFLIYCFPQISLSSPQIRLSPLRQPSESVWHGKSNSLATKNRGNLTNWRLQAETEFSHLFPGAHHIEYRSRLQSSMIFFVFHFSSFIFVQFYA